MDNLYCSFVIFLMSIYIVNVNVLIQHSQISAGLSLLKQAAMTDKEFHSEASKPSKPSAELEGGPESLGNVSVEGAGNETILALYYSGDIYVQMCWWLGYTFLILCTAVWISWRLFGQEISEILLLQGYQLPEKTSRPKQNQRQV